MEEKHKRWKLKSTDQIWTDIGKEQLGNSERIRKIIEVDTSMETIEKIHIVTVVLIEFKKENWTGDGGFESGRK